MRRLMLLAVALTLVGCNKSPDAVVEGETRHGNGRYTGIGIYTPGELWTHLQTSTGKEPAPNLADDDEIIVVIDTQTGEVRQCGNMSGICTAIQPWRSVVNEKGAPIPLAKHAADLEAERAKAGK